MPAKQSQQLGYGSFVIARFVTRPRVIIRIYVIEKRLVIQRRHSRTVTITDLT
jgi:hypothetical protein